MGDIKNTDSIPEGDKKHNEVNPLKASRLRRRKRPKKTTVIETPVENQDNQLQFQIIAIYKTQVGCAIRIKDNTKTKIQLYNFIESRSNNTIETDMASIPRADALNSLVSTGVIRKTRVAAQAKHCKSKAQINEPFKEKHRHKKGKPVLVQKMHKPVLEQKMDKPVLEQKDKPVQKMENLKPTKHKTLLQSQDSPKNNLHVDSQRNNKPAYSKRNTKPPRLNKQNKPPLQEQNQTSIKSSIHNQGKVKQVSKQKSHPRKQKPRVDSNKENDVTFQEYVSEEEVLTGIRDGKYFRGIIRVNSNHSRIAFVTATDFEAKDFYVGSITDRNKAMDGDIVAVELLPESEWNGRTCVSKIVYIFEKVHPRTAVGYITAAKRGDFNSRNVRFIPRDRSFPILDIDGNSLPRNFRNHKQTYSTAICHALLTNWNTPKQADGEIIEVIGEDFDLKAEQRAILLDNGIDICPFPVEAQAEVPKSFEVDATELAYRMDLRNECVFTIDPLSARDLDDALHIKKLSNGNYEVGVHIADVTHYLKEGSVLDSLVSKRATSTYLVDEVVHMLPQDFCLGCSLLPHKESLSFSVIWELTSQGDIVNQRFTRSVIFNCVKLAYEHAQWMIDHPLGQFPKDFPKIARYKPKVIRQRVLMMAGIARYLRKKRYDNGALKIGRIVLEFKLDSNGNPVNASEKITGEANQMIEEFMLLANMSVAEKIYSVYPEMSFLRRHAPPKKTMLTELQERMEVIGIHIKIDTSAEISSSLNSFISNDYFGYARNVAASHMFAKPMTRAVYFSTAGMKPDDFYHFALSVPKYTHFTSPIRRYADIIVHRLLGACLDYNPPPNLTIESMCVIANRCNKMKNVAKRAGDDSVNFMLLKFIAKNQPFITDAVIVGVTENAFDAIVLSTGSVVRVFMTEQDLHQGIYISVEPYGPAEKMHKMQVFMKKNNQSVLVQVIDIFQLVLLSLRRKGRTCTLEANWFAPKIIINDQDYVELVNLQFNALSIRA